MQEYTINGKKKICYVVKKGDVNDVVIAQESLQWVDMKRIEQMEAQGGELMRVMRDTVLDNGTNALSLYKDLLRVVPNPRAVVKESSSDGEKEESSSETTTTSAAPKKRGRGRPRKKS